MEKGLDELIAQARRTARSAPRRDTGEAVNATDLSLICVGTPSRNNGSLDLTYLERVCEQIGEALRTRDDYHVVVVRSTVLPGTTHDVVIPALERSSGKNYGNRLRRRGESGVPARRHRDPRLPPSADDARRPQLRSRTRSRTEALYAKVEAPLVTTSIRTAEMIKYAEQHLARAEGLLRQRESGNLCKRLEIDSHEVMDIFCRDEKLNLSSYYMKPGFAFGGSCLPKDVRAHAVPRQGSRSRHAGRSSQSSAATTPDPACARPDDRNRPQARRPARLQLQGGHRRPAGEPASSSSPRRCSARAIELRIYDRNVSIARLVGANKRVHQHSRSLTCRRCCAIRSTRSSTNPTCIVVGNAAPEFAEALRGTRPDQTVIDLVRVKIDRSRFPRSTRESAGDTDAAIQVFAGSWTGSDEKPRHLAPDVVEAGQQLMVVVQHVQLDVRLAPRPPLHAFGIDRGVAASLEDLDGTSARR